MTGPRDEPAGEPHDPGPHYPNSPFPDQPYPQPGSQQYPGHQGYPGHPYPGHPQPEYPQPGVPLSRPATHRTLSPRVASAAARRPAPRLGVALAGVGVVLVIAGVLVWGVSYLATGFFDQVSGDGGDGMGSRQYLGAVLGIVVAALGYALLIRTRVGPLSTAGVAASALGVPVALVFLTFSTGSQPFNTDAVVWVSILIWLASYLFVPGAQGRVFYLGASLLTFWEYILDKAAPSASGVAGAVAGRFGIDSSDGGDFGTGSLAAASLVIGIGYYALAYALDRRERRGAAVAFALVGFPAVLVGIIALGPDLEQVGTGLVLIAAGLVFGAYGARFGRRFTTWAWALGAGAGGVLVISRIVTHGGTSIGVALIALGVVFVAGGWLAARLLRESAQPGGVPMGVPVGEV